MSSSPRYHAFDTLRAFAMLLGIFFHAALAYIDPPDAGWAVNDASRHEGMSLFVWASHGFRMQVFFLMSGFFSHLLYQRYGAQRFLRHRFQRIGLPFVLGLVTIVPLVMYLWLWAQTNGLTDSVHALVADAGVGQEPLSVGLFLRNLVPAHLWFLEYLLVLCVASYLLVPLLRSVPLGRERFDRAFRWLVQTSWKPLWLAIPTGLAMWWCGRWTVVGGPQGFVPEPPIVAYYTLFFGFGWLLYRHVDLLDGLARQWRRYLAFAVLLLPTPALLFMQDRVDDPFWGFYAVATIALSAAFTWLMVFGLTGLFLRFLDREDARVRYVSDSTYWLYLAHIPLVPFLHVIGAHFSAPLLVEYFAVNAVALVLLFLSYEHLVRYTWLGAMLNGPRQRETRTLSPSVAGAD